ncbi:LysR family transcriptional regulator [Serinicoccus sp. CUA-874]|uniref:LysR family transcriptional regulator n=1 Tax=Serinicoccus sp. CUA-874 TaxID=1517939 RepID=UPI001EDB8046|nr:LysR family transcriptional regulator [Serinicoccus sp. CUA-874]
MPLADLSLRDLRSFLAVVDEGTFTDAAIALRTTQRRSRATWGRSSRRSACGCCSVAAGS